MGAGFTFVRGSWDRTEYPHRPFSLIRLCCSGCFGAVLRLPSHALHGLGADRPADQTKALCPVIALPTISAFISLVPSNE
ncbi:hypothetical protein QF030_001000 [Streptomyces rishiriensis]|uniref:Uncharacterized protein n=1 Tax=Streptomyces rishiriensis TaxID=68264 RepID=A0ABU0NI72_STRRH|nr:hypothetical protein [Streptomyces rishiriensis]